MIHSFKYKFPHIKRKLDIISLWIGRMTLGAVFFLTVLFVYFVLNKETILTEMAEAWSYSDEPEKSDAVIILGGGYPFRAERAIEYYKAGLVDKIVLLNPVDARDSKQKNSKRKTEKDFSEVLLLNNGIPAESIIQLPMPVDSSHDETLVITEWVKENSIKSIIVPTNTFHTRRVRWLYQKRFKGSLDCEVYITDITIYGQHTDNWWKGRDGIVSFFNEVAKYLFYVITY